ncbi:MAG TPA: hypothetical protein DHU69_06640 [Deltaproteobacteria bacterium]|nr:hypothetical protein [Deltaproteobacteria bacterium]
MQIDISPKTELWLKEGLISLAILAGFFIIAKLVKYFLAKWVYRITKHTETELDDKIVETARGPVYYIILLSGLYLGLDNLPLTLKIKTIGDGIIYIFGVGVGLLLAYRVVNVFLEWYTQSVTKKTESQLEKNFCL